MRVIDSVSKYSPKRGLCLTIGNFDGLHKGHQALINRTREIAAEKDLDFAVMTFWPHPRAALSASAPHFPLTDRAERLRLMEAMGIPLVFELPFDSRVAGMSAREFAGRALAPLSPAWLVTGYDFCMGHNREGTPEVLNKLGRELGFSVERIPPFETGGAPASSSRARAYLARGDMSAARELLGRPYALNGTIIHGEGRGRILGYPTANLGNVQSMLPAGGVYACLAHAGEKTLPAATSIGSNPTFNGGGTTIESFLLKGGGDLYGQSMRLEFVEKIRDQKKFASAEELALQIGRDAERAGEILSNL